MRDKLLHFITGLIITILTYPIFKIYSIFLVTAFALLKEIYDYIDAPNRKDVELLDVAFTLMGSYLILIFLSDTVIPIALIGGSLVTLFIISGELRLHKSKKRLRQKLKKIGYTEEQIEDIIHNST